MVMDGAAPGEVTVLPRVSSTLAAFVFVARRRGVDLSETQLRRAYAADEGVPAERLVPIARENGLTAKVIHAKWRDLGRLVRSLPAILCLRDGNCRQQANCRLALSPLRVGRRS